MSKGDLKPKSKMRQGQVEDILAGLSRVCIDLSEITTRTEQAIKRTALVYPVLYPSLERLDEIRARVMSIQSRIAAYWAEEQARRWEDE